MVNLRQRKWRTYCPCEKLQASEPHGVAIGHRKLGDDNEAEDHDEEENVELQEPPEEVEVGEDTGSKLASNDLECLLPQADGIKEL